MIRKLSFGPSGVSDDEIDDEELYGSVSDISSTKKSSTPSSKEILVKIFELFGVPIHSAEVEKREILPRLNTPRKLSSPRLLLNFDSTPPTPDKPPFRRRRSTRAKRKQTVKGSTTASPIDAVKLLERVDHSNLAPNMRLRYVKFKTILIESVFHSPHRGDLDELLGFNRKQIEENIKLTFAECYAKLGYLAQLRYPALKVEEALEQACATYLYPYVTKTVKTATRLVQSFASWITDDADVAAMFHFYQAPLHRVFNYYSKKIEPERELSNKALFMWNNTMSEKAFLLFASEFSIVPKFVADQQLKMIFSAIKMFDHKKSDSITRSALSIYEADTFKQNFDINEFMEGLARIASSMSGTETVQGKCRELLNYIEERYNTIFGEPMLVEKSRLLTNKQRRNEEQTEIATQFDFDTIVGERNILMTKEEASKIRAKLKKKQGLEKRISEEDDIELRPLSLSITRRREKPQVEQDITEEIVISRSRLMTPRTTQIAQEKLPYEIVPKKITRQYDIFKGPKMIAKCEDQPGYIIYEGPNSGKYSNWSRSPFMKLVLLNTDDDEVNFDEATKDAILRHSSITNNFEAFLERLLDHGMDLIGSVIPVSHSPIDVTFTPRRSPQTLEDVRNREYLVGRSWRITKSKKVIGCVVDHFGYFGCLQWQPREDFLQNSDYSMTLYIPPKTTEFNECFNMYAKSKDMDILRTHLERAGYETIPTVYF